MYARAGVTRDHEVVTYCQGGYRAAHTYLALRCSVFPGSELSRSWKSGAIVWICPIEHPKDRDGENRQGRRLLNLQRDRYVDELKQYLAIPRISALPEHQADVRKAPEWSADHLRPSGWSTCGLEETLEIRSCTPTGQRGRGPHHPLLRPLRRSASIRSSCGSRRRRSDGRENEIYARGAATTKGSLHALQSD